MVDNHIPINKLSYRKPVKKWLCERYGKEQAAEIWKKTEDQYNEYLKDLPDYGGNRNPLAKEYRIEKDENGFLVSKKI
ncbi:MAG: hypothetical protein IKP14_03240 [Clostridiales bacterium]|nr:hypothetical protein [Clostridiales bacterium]